MKPVDLSTGRPCGAFDEPGHYVLKGYLITLPDGYECRMAPDKTRADLYAAANHGTVEPLFVRRELPR